MEFASLFIDMFRSPQSNNCNISHTRQISDTKQTCELQQVWLKIHSQIKAKVLFMHFSLCSQGWRYAISMKMLIFPCLTQITITSCFAASAVRNGVTSLILCASNTTTRFSSGLSNFCNFTTRIHQKRSQMVRNPKFSLGGGGLQI